MTAPPADLVARTLDLAQRCIAGGATQQAEQLLTELLTALPAATPAALLLARVRADAGLTTAALEASALALSHAPGDAATLALHLELLARALRAATSPQAPALDAAASARELQQLHAERRFAELEQRCHALLTRHPDFAFGWKLLGVLALERADGDPTPHLHALALQPNDAGSWANYGLARHSRGESAAAEQACRQALTLQPGHVDAWVNLGVIHYDQGDYAAAADCAARALASAPGHREAGVNLGNALLEQNQLEAAEQAYRKALRHAPDNLPARFGLARTLVRGGHHEEGYATLQQILQQADAAPVPPPRRFLTEVLSSTLFALNYVAAPEAPRLALARRYGALVAEGVSPCSHAGHNADPQRPLRIGLVSGDLGQHPVGIFLATTVEALRGAPFELVAYRSHCREDAVWQRIAACLLGWRDVKGWDDARLAQQIQADRIDILLDLAGHTAYNRLPLFAHKPAPVQATWLGYFATTGVAAMDYILTNATLLPPADEALYTERPWRLPGPHLCFSPPQARLEVSPSPLAQGRAPTLGCFNTLAKLNDEVLALWSRLLHARPDATLFLKARQLGSAAARDALQQRFAAHGITPARLRLEGPSSHEDYLRAYQEVDLLLDPFPFPGGTTTVEGLWMGLPTVTLRGHNWIGRQGAMLLETVGLSDWIADSPADYQRIVLDALAQPTVLDTLRQQLRPRLLSSPLCDATQFATHLADALRGMWQAWCATQAAQPPAP